MRITDGSMIVDEVVNMCRTLTKSSFGINELMRIYMATPVSDCFSQDGSMGGYVPHKRRMRKRNYFV